MLPFDIGTMAEEEKGTSSWYKVPCWDGNPSNFRSFKKEMGWWLASLDPESCRKYNLAARWTLRQSGIVRARCEEFDPEELKGVDEIKGTDPVSGDEVILQAADPFAGIRKLMSSLEESMGRTEMDKKAELRKQFYQDIRRSPGERMSTFCTRYRTLMSEMRREGIELPTAELGWFFKDRVGLDAIRVQLLETALQGRENYEAVEQECLRLFRDLHASDPLYKSSKPAPLLHRFLASQNSSTSSHSHGKSSFPSSGASTFSGRSRSSFAPSNRGGGRWTGNTGANQRQAMVTEEVAEYDHDDDEELIPDRAEHEGVPASLEEVLQTEAEVLAAELQELEEDGCSPEMMADLEQGVEQAAECLVSMREARSKIAEIKKDRGFGKSNPQLNAAPKKMTGNQVPGKKARSNCWDCGQTGHWAGDAGCPHPGEGLFKPKKPGGVPTKQVRVAEALNTEHSVEEDEVPHEVMMTSARLFGCQSFEEALERSNEVSNVNVLAVDKDGGRFGFRLQ